MSAVYEWGYTIGPDVDIKNLYAHTAEEFWKEEVGPEVVAARNAFRDQEIIDGYTSNDDLQLRLNRGSRTFFIARQFTGLAHAQARQVWTEAIVPASTTNLTQIASRAIDQATLDQKWITTDE